MKTEKQKEYARRYYQAHKEEMQAQHKVWVAAHKEELKQARAERHELNREKETQQAMAWKASHPEATRKSFTKYNEAHRDQTNAYLADYRGANRELLNSKAKVYNANNREKIRASYIKRKYGMTLEEWDALFEEQCGGCAICKQPLEAVKKLVIDHCHNSSKVRGLLCSNCNTGLGLFKDNPESLQAAIEYLKRTDLEICEEDSA